MVAHLVPASVAARLLAKVASGSERIMSYDDDFDDEFDDFEDATFGAAPAAPIAPVTGDRAIHDSETLLRRAIDIIATARTIPLSASPMINRDEIIELLEEAVNRLPDELRQARWMLKERAEFVAKTRREADEILDAARVQAERMVQRTEVVRAAEQRARQVKEAAEPIPVGSATRPRTSSTSGSPASRSCSTRSPRRSPPVAPGCRSACSRTQERAVEPTADDPDSQGFFDQDRSGF